MAALHHLLFQFWGAGTAAVAITMYKHWAHLKCKVQLLYSFVMGSVVVWSVHLCDAYGAHIQFLSFQLSPSAIDVAVVVGRPDPYVCRFFYVGFFCGVQETTLQFFQRRGSGKECHQGRYKNIFFFLLKVTLSQDVPFNQSS